MPHLGVINLTSLAAASIIIILCCKGCRSKNQGCSNPPGIANGDIEPLKQKYSFNEHIEYRCYLGYLLIGSSIQRCLNNDTWNSSTPMCVPNTCGLPGHPLNGSNNYNKSNPSNETIYSCDKGFVLVGDKNRRCLPEGYWWPEKIPKCISNLAYGGSVNQSLSPVPKPPHPWIDGNFSNVYNLTNVIDKKGSVWWAVDLKAIHFVTNIYLHLSKYVAKGSSATLTFKTTTSSSMNVTTASKIIDVSVEHSNNALQVRVNREGRIFFIQSQGNISASEVEIVNNNERIQNCGQPDEPPYSILKITDKPQYSVEYSCSSFYSIQGSSRSVSCVDGQWSGRPPKCIPRYSTTTTTTKRVTTHLITTTSFRPTVFSTSAPTTHSGVDPNNVAGYVGIMGIAMGAVAASLAIIIAVIVVVCIMKKYYKHKHTIPLAPPSSAYTSPRDYLDSHSSTSRSYDGSHRGNSVHLYDSIRDTPGVLGSRSPTDYDVSDFVYNEGYGVKGSPLSNRRYEQLRTVPRTTPVYDEVREGEEGIPMTSAVQHWDSSDQEYNGSRVDSLYIAGAPRTTL